MIKINQTPVRTSRNFHINNIEIKDFKIPKSIGKFNNVEIIGETSNISIDKKLTYGLGAELEKQVIENTNQKISFEIDNDEKQARFYLDKKNINLVDQIQILAKENSKGKVTIIYESEKDVEVYHNGIIHLKACENAKLDIIIVNLINDISYNFLSIENELDKNANITYTVIDLGSKQSISNYYTNLIGDESNSQINTIYLGKSDELYDINYIAHLRGRKSVANIEVQGALKDYAKKNFKGTIDFKTGCKKAKGNENESCLLLSDTAKSLALPMLLCSEEDVEGAHSTSAGKMNLKELFYIMSRGLSKKEAEKLLVRAKFNNILENIKDVDLNNRILDEIDNRLD